MGRGVEAPLELTKTIMNYSKKTIGGADVLFFTIFIVGISFAGGVVPSAAYADYGDSYFADVDYGGNFFGNPGADCCSSTNDYGGSYLADVDYGNVYGLDNSGNSYLADIDYGNGYGINNYGGLYLADVDYGSGYGVNDYGKSYLADVDYGGSYLADVDYGSSYFSDIDYGVGYLAGINYGGGYYGGSYGGSFTFGGGQQYYTSKSTVHYIDTTKKYYNVQTVNPFIPQPRCEIRYALSSGYGQYGQGAYLSWTSTSANSAYISGIGSVSLNGSQYVYPTNTTTYTMTVYGQNGSNTCSTTIPGYTPAPVAPSCEIRYTQTPGYNYGYNYGNSGSLLSWSSTNASSAYITNIGSVSLNGSQNVYPTVPTTYAMTVYGANGGSNTCSTTVPVNQYIPPYTPPTYNNLYCTISATRPSIYGQGAILNWTSYGASSATLSDGIGNVALNGSLTVRPESARVYTLTIYDNQGRTNTCYTSISGIPYVSLTSIPYTGFDGGPMVQIIYWLSLVLFAGAAGYLVVNYRGGIQSVVANLFGERLYAPAYVTPDAVILNETIIAKGRNDIAGDVREEAPIKAETPRVVSNTKDNMILEVRAGETPRLVINRH